MYINKMPFGHNTYGVEAASKFFFRHSAKDNTVARICYACYSACTAGSLLSYPLS